METLCPMAQCLFFLEVTKIFVDAHNHLKHYEENLAKALEIINEKEIWTLACAINKKDYLWLKELAENQPFIIPCYGIHPWEINPELEELNNQEEMLHFIKETAVIGEIGLDFYWAKDSRNYPLQVETLTFFFENARKYNKIVNLHTKGAEREILDLLKIYELRTPIIHWYNGPLELVNAFIDLDCYWTISVDITESEKTRELVARLPFDKILTETDGPTALEWVNGHYAYPDYIERIVEEIAKIKEVDSEFCRRQINDNFRELLAGEVSI